MPIYEYKCVDCNNTVSILFKSFSDQAKPVCDKCNGFDLTRLMSQITYIKPWGESLTYPDFEGSDSDAE